MTHPLSGVVARVENIRLEQNTASLIVTCLARVRLGTDSDPDNHELEYVNYSSFVQLCPEYDLFLKNLF